MTVAARLLINEIKHIQIYLPQMIKDVEIHHMLKVW